MRTWLILVLTMLPTFALAAPADSQENKACYELEVDPSTRRRYQNEAQWNADREKLASLEPTRPGMYTLYVAYQLTKTESVNARAMKSDKRAHCYMGCRVANEVSVAAAEYAAWYKEDRDINDCNPKSQFELRDIVATQVGIEIAEDNFGFATKELCQKVCRQQVPR